MNVARYKKGFISTAEYDSKLHFGNIMCPHCAKVKMKMVRKAGVGSSFDFVKDGDEHDELCPYYVKPIDDEVITDLVKSDSKKDMSRINYLVNANIERSINLLTKLENNSELTKENTLDLMPNKRKFMAEKKIRGFAKQNIRSINAINLHEELDNIKDKYVIIYGKAGISVSDIDISKKIIFKVNKDIRFSIFIAPKQLQYFNYRGGYNANFVIFGKVKSKGHYINIGIRSTRDLYIQE